jgi:hypothetical protein
MQARRANARRLLYEALRVRPGNPAIVDPQVCRPVALRPRLSTGLPLQRGHSLADLQLQTTVKPRTSELAKRELQPIRW